jgi:hypothetical protein
MEKCEHEFVFNYATQRLEETDFDNMYERNEFYYCKKCLEQKKIVKTSYDRKSPDWWRSGK